MARCSAAKAPIDTLGLRGGIHDVQRVPHHPSQIHSAVLSCSFPVTTRNLEEASTTRACARAFRSRLLSARSTVFWAGSVVRMTCSHPRMAFSGVRSHANGCQELILQPAGLLLALSSAADAWCCSWILSSMALNDHELPHLIVGHLRRARRSRR